ncbi:MAG: acetolactate synthase small subunit [Lentihominibacter sp.]
MNYDKSFRRRWLSLFVENQIGVLARISGLLSGKSYNIHSLTVGETQDRAISRMTVCLDADDNTFEQIMKQLNRSVEVIKVMDITDASIRSKEVMFIKIKGINERDRAEVFQMAQAFKFRIKDMDHNSVLVEAVRTEIVNDSILNLINERFKNIEVVRGGPVAIESISMQDR